MYFVVVFMALMQISVNGFALDRAFPMDITSKKFEIRQKENHAIFQGDVKLSYGEVKLGADTLDIHYAKEGNEDIKEVMATGKVTIVQGASTATGDKAVYTPKLGHVLMTGNVVLTRDGSVLKGEKLVYNIETGDMSIANPKNKGRVKATFSIKGKN